MHDQQTSQPAGLALLIALALVLAACGFAPPAPTDTPTVTPVPVADAPATDTPAAPTGDPCPTATADTQLIRDEVQGFCFLVPARFTLEQPGSDLMIYAPASTPGHRERGFVAAAPTDFATAAEAVEFVVNDVRAAIPGFTPEQRALTLGGVDAIQVDNLPGQDINRQIFAVTAGRLYHLTFVPVEPTRPDALAEMEELYALMVASFGFFSPTAVAPTPRVSNAQAALVWEGEIEGACHVLTIGPVGQAGVALCGEDITATAETVNGWDTILAHFAALDAATAAGTIHFQGQGYATGEVWAHALATWAQTTAMEVKSGRVGAAVPTALAWTVNVTPDATCTIALVQTHGYATVSVAPCDGPQLNPVAQGWLTDDEMTQFHAWLTTGARVQADLGYLDARGDQPLAAETVAAWAAALAARLAP